MEASSVHKCASFQDHLECVTTASGGHCQRDSRRLIAISQDSQTFFSNRFGLKTMQQDLRRTL